MCCGALLFFVIFGEWGGVEKLQKSCKKVVAKFVELKKSITFASQSG